MRELGDVGGDRSLGQHTEGRRRTLEFGRMPRAGASFAAASEERLGDAVLERMERDHNQAAFGLKNTFSSLQPRNEFTQLVIDEDAQRLECARRGVDIARPRTHYRGDDVSERSSGADWHLGASLDD